MCILSYELLLTHQSKYISQVFGYSHEMNKKLYMLKAYTVHEGDTNEKSIVEH